MPDMTMCTGGQCPARKECYRHMAVPSRDFQSYGYYDIYMKPEDDKCDQFMKIGNRRIREEVKNEKSNGSS